MKAGKYINLRLFCHYIFLSWWYFVDLLLFHHFKIWLVSFSGKSLDVVICDWWNPRDFYIHLRKKEPEFKRFVYELNRFYEIDVKNDEDYVVHGLPGIHEGLIVAALFWATQHKSRVNKCLGMRIFLNFQNNSVKGGGKKKVTKFFFYRFWKCKLHCYFIEVLHLQNFWKRKIFYQIFSIVFDL